MRDPSRVLFRVKRDFAGGSLRCTQGLFAGVLLADDCLSLLASLCIVCFSRILPSREAAAATSAHVHRPTPFPSLAPGGRRRRNYYDFALILKIGPWESQCSFSKPFWLFRYICLFLLGIFVISSRKGLCSWKILRRSCMFGLSDGSPAACLHFCPVMDWRSVASLCQCLLSPLVLLLVLSMAGLFLSPNTWLPQHWRLSPGTLWVPGCGVWNADSQEEEEGGRGA